MAIAGFVKGGLVEIEHHKYKLTRKVDLNIWQLEDSLSGQFKTFSHAELQHLYVNQKLIFVNDTEFYESNAVSESRKKRQEVAALDLDSAQLKRLKEQTAYVMAVENLPTSENILKPAIRKVWEKLGRQGKPPNWISVVRWKKRYFQSSHDGNSLRHRHYLKGNRSERYPIQVLEILKDSIEQIYLTRERNTVEATLNHAIVMVERKNKMLPSELQLPLPTRKLVQRFIDYMDSFDRHAARYGNLAATKKFRSVLHMNVSNAPMECAEIDHTQLDLMVIDETTGMPLGRPWVTICIDRYTRCILGIHIGFEPPSYLTVARCLKHAFLPKVDIREKYPDIENEWLAHGVMLKLIVDNGLEFHGISLEAVCLALGIDLQFTPRKTPWWKGIVERVIGTMNRNVAHGHPGTTFSNIFDKGDYDPVKHAAITLNTLKLTLNKWIVDDYHQKPHRSLDNISPDKKWTSSINPEEIFVPDNPARLDAILGSVDQRTLTHKGIEYLGMFYNSPDLVGLRRRMGEKLKVEIRVDQGDLGHIHVIAPDSSEIFRVPCLDMDYADGLSSWQHEVCKRYARTHLTIGNNSNAWRHAKVAISEIVQREMFGRKRKINAKAARFGNASSEKHTSKKTDHQSKHISDTRTLDVVALPMPTASLPPANFSKQFKPLIESRDSHN